MLQTAGFVEVGSADLTDEYLITQTQWIDATAKREAALREILGESDYDERMENRRRTKAAIEAGLLARFMYWAKRPERGAS